MGLAVFLAVSPAVLDVHRTVAFVLVGGWLALALYGTVLWVVKREAGRVYYVLLRCLEGLLVLQIIPGVILLATGGSRPVLHYGYGAVFPAVVLVVAEVLSRGLEKPPLHAFYTIAAWVVLALMLRALMTGLGG